VRLGRGWNLVAAPYPYQGLSTTAIAAQAACGVKAIATRQDASYRSWTPGQAARPVPATGGFWLLCASSGSWTPHLS
jgi:hypothetical protein